MFAIAPLLPGFHEVVSVVSLTTSPTQLVRPDPRRAILYLANNANDEVYLWLERTDLDPDCPHIVMSPYATRRFTWSEDGPMSTFGWRAKMVGQPADVAIVEILWHPDQLAQSLSGA